MFVGDEVHLDVGFSVAQSRLANLIRGSSLVAASEDAYAEGIAGLVRVGPLGSTPGLSRLVEAHFRDLVTRDGSALLTLRWEALGPGGRLFPALDADLTLAPAGDEATLLTLAGAYRPPLGVLGAGLDRTILHRVAVATVRTFTSSVATAIAHPAPVPERHGRIVRSQPSWLPATGETP
jgi:hypothetical protein